MDGKMNIMLAMGTAAILTGVIACSPPAESKVVEVADESVSLSSFGAVPEMEKTEKKEAEEQNYGNGNFSFMLDNDWHLMENGEFYYTFYPGESLETADAYLGVDYRAGENLETILQLRLDGQGTGESEDAEKVSAATNAESEEDDLDRQDAMPPAWSQVTVGTGNYPAVMVEYHLVAEDGEESSIDCQSVYYIQERDGVIELTLAARENSSRMVQLDRVLDTLTLENPGDISAGEVTMEKESGEE